MIFSPEHIALIEQGIKTETRRIGHPVYKVDRVYAVQPGRGKHGVGFIRMIHVWQHLLLLDEDFGGMHSDNALAEGYFNIPAFLRAFCRINKLQWPPPNVLVTAYRFEYIGKEKP